MNSNNETMNVLSDLIEFESVTPDKSGCQKYIDNYLSKFGFKTKYFDALDVKVHFESKLNTYGKDDNELQINTKYKF